MMTEILEKPEVVTSNDNGDHERFAHYFRKADIEKAYLNGEAIQALCGKIDVPLRDPKKFSVCPQCKEVFDTMKP